MAQTSVQPPAERIPARPPAPRRPKRSFTWRALRAIRSRLGAAFSREGLLSGVKTLAWVVPMTVVIWVYAEREQIARQTVLFRVEAKNSSPDRQVVELISRGPEGRNFTVRAD